ncbi:hypothetical protein [Streptomyces rubrogriseus]
MPQLPQSAHDLVGHTSGGGAARGFKSPARSRSSAAAFFSGNRT